MAMKFKKEETVRQIAPVIQGKIINVAIVDDEVAYEVAYTGADGEEHTRFFKEGELEPVPESAE